MPDGQATFQAAESVPPVVADAIEALLASQR